MALEKRITAALRASSRLKDVRDVIDEAEAAILDMREKHGAEDARSIDPALTTAEARAARNAAADLAHDVRRLEASLVQLGERRDAILADTAYEERCRRFAAAKAERDALVVDIRARYPVLAAELLDLARRIEASDLEIAEVNKNYPRDEKPLRSAEFEARGITGYSWPNMQPVNRIAQAQLPVLTGDGYYLPLAHASLYARAIEVDQAIASASAPEKEKADA